MLSTVAYATHRRRRSSSDVSRNISFLALGDSVASYHRYSLNPENSNSLTFTQTFLHNLSKISRWTLAYNFELESYR